MMELSSSSSFCPGTFPPTTNFFLFNRTIPPVHINNLNNQTKPPVHINNLRVNQGCPVPAKRVGLIKKIQIQNKQPHLGAKQGIAPADYTISNQNTPAAGCQCLLYPDSGHYSLCCSWLEIANSFGRIL